MPGKTPREIVLGDIDAQCSVNDKRFWHKKDDDDHTPGDWHLILLVQLGKAAAIGQSVTARWEEHRERLIKLAATAVNAVEAFDRRYATVEALPGHDAD